MYLFWMFRRRILPPSSESRVAYAQNQHEAIPPSATSANCCWTTQCHIPSHCPSSVRTTTSDYNHKRQLQREFLRFVLLLQCVPRKSDSGKPWNTSVRVVCVAAEIWTEWPHASGKHYSMGQSVCGTCPHVRRAAITYITSSTFLFSFPRQAKWMKQMDIIQ
jgi:hypothetical protein